MPRFDMRTDFLDKGMLIPQATYVRELREHLPTEVFEPATSRLLLIPLHLAVITVATVMIAARWLPAPLFPLLSVVIGVSFAGLVFVGHEAVHGGIVRGRTIRQVVGWIGFLPFTVSQRLWAAWHDRVHHANANLADDPDMYPTLDTYRSSRRTRFFIDAFSLGGRRWRGGLSLILGFTVQSSHQLLSARGRLLKPRAFRLAVAETVAGVAVWTTVALLVGGLAFVFVYVLPLLVANSIVMAFILTNHSLSPRVEINDPLVSGLSVTTPRWVELLTLRFGYHVEHHLFPAMSSRHAGLVRAQLEQRWPKRYQSMPLTQALSHLHRTSRIYKDAITLVDPRTGDEYPTLQPREPAREPPPLALAS